MGSGNVQIGTFVPLSSRSKADNVGHLECSKPCVLNTRSRAPLEHLKSDGLRKLNLSFC